MIGLFQRYIAQMEKELPLQVQMALSRSYTTDIEELLQIAESRVTRQLTAEEKERYGVLDLN